MFRELSLSFIVLLAVLSATVYPQTAATSSSQGNGGLTGTVKIGKNPAKGIAITLLPERDQSQRMPPGMQQLQSQGQGQTARATSDQNGQFQFTNIAAGAYRVVPMADAYVISNAGARFGGVTVNIAEGQTSAQVDLTLTRGGVISGRVTDPNGHPVIAERISLESIDETGKAQQYNGGRFGYETDDRGVYRVFGLPEGRYLVSAGNNDGGRMPGRRARYIRTWYPDALEEAQARIIEVTAGNTVEGIDIKLSEMIKGYAVEGRAVDAETGQPVMAIPIIANRGRGFGPGPGGPGAMQNSFTNEKGEFKITGLTAGSYTLAVSSSFAAAAPGADPLDAQQVTSDYYSDPASFEISGMDVSGIEVKVHFGASIAGYVVVDGAADPSLSSQLSQLMVSASVRGGASSAQSSRGPGAGRQSIAQVGLDGSFRLSGLAPGIARLNLNSFGGSNNFALVRIERNGAPLPGDLELASGQQVNGIVMVTSYANGVISGKVNVVGGTLPNGTMLRISARPLGGTGQNKNTMVGSDGTFRIEGLLTGSYEVSVNANTRGGGGPGGGGPGGGGPGGRGGRGPGSPGNSGTNSGTGSGTGSGSGSGTGTGNSQVTIPEVKQTTNVTNGRESNVTLTLDLSKQ